MRSLTAMKNQARAEVMGQSAVIFFLIFTIEYILPDKNFRRRAKGAIIAFTIIRILLKFAIFIPHKEAMAMKRLQQQYMKYLVQYAWT